MHLKGSSFPSDTTATNNHPRGVFIFYILNKRNNLKIYIFDLLYKPSSPGHGSPGLVSGLKNGGLQISGFKTGRIPPVNGTSVLGRKFASTAIAGVPIADKPTLATKAKLAALALELIFCNADIKIILHNYDCVAKLSLLQFLGNLFYIEKVKTRLSKYNFSVKVLSRMYHVKYH